MACNNVKRHINLRLRQAHNLANRKVDVGIVNGEQYPDGTKVAEVAAVHEFGAPHKNIPQRAFLRPTVADKRYEWVKMIDSMLEKENGAEVILGRLGDVAKGDVVQTIVNLHNPPLSEKTIKARARKYKNPNLGNLAKPLIDTSVLINSISYRVK